MSSIARVSQNSTSTTDSSFNAVRSRSNFDNNGQNAHGNKRKLSSLSVDIEQNRAENAPKKQRSNNDIQSTNGSRKRRSRSVEAEQPSEQSAPKRPRSNFRSVHNGSSRLPAPAQKTDSQKSRDERWERRALNKERGFKEAATVEKKLNEKERLKFNREICTIKLTAQTNLGRRASRKLKLEKNYIHGVMYARAYPQILTHPCSLCRQKFTDEREVIVYRQCGDQFHINCIPNWLAANGPCPFASYH